MVLCLWATYVFQCLTMASVESMMVPSMSKRKPSKVRVTIGPLKAPVVGNGGTCAMTRSVDCKSNVD